MTRPVSLIVAAGLLLIATVPAAEGLGSAREGQDLYEGRLALVGRLHGHKRAMPADTVRCANCHESDESASAPSATAPRLDRESLTATVSRRGGRPFAYDEAGFCGVLREGVGPDFVLLRRSMPRYVISDEQCASLWHFLSARAPRSADRP